MSKISGHWPRSNSTSKAHRRLWGCSGSPFGFIQLDGMCPLEILAKLDGAEREDYLEWILEQRRKAKMMQQHWQSEMRETAGIHWPQLRTGWDEKGKHEFTALITLLEHRHKTAFELLFERLADLDLLTA